MKARRIKKRRLRRRPKLKKEVETATAEHKAADAAHDEADKKEDEHEETLEKAEEKHEEAKEKHEEAKEKHEEAIEAHDAHPETEKVKESLLSYKSGATHLVSYTGALILAMFC